MDCTGRVNGKGAGEGTKIASTARGKGHLVQTSGVTG